MASNQALSKDAWLSGVMGKSCVRVSSEHADSASLGSLNTPGTFAYAKVDPAQVKQCLALQEAGFYLVDTNVQLTMVSFHGNAENRVRARFAKKDEPANIVSEVCRIAETAFEFTRFHLDPKVSRPVADKVKREWVSNFFRGERGDQLVLAEDSSGKPIGFLLALKANGRTVIDLIATSRETQGRGAGRAMVAALAKANPGPIEVGTQLANIPSLSFYQRMGFAVTGAKYVFHFHSGAGA